MQRITNSIRVRVNQDHWNITSKVFSGGEIHVDLDHLPSACNDYNIKARLQCSEDIMHFIMICNALGHRYGGEKGTLTIPYMPYARQDRVCSSGQHFGLEQFVLILQTLPQKTIYVYDLHSQVCKNLLCDDGSNIKVIEMQQYAILQHYAPLHQLIKSGNVAIVSPDNGAQDKSRKVAEICESPHGVIVAEKRRDPATGWLTTAPLTVDLQGRDVLIVDDICDGGATFFGLAKELRKANCGIVNLYVTHGIFSKGFDGFSGLIDNIYTTDSFLRNDSYGSDEMPKDVTLTTFKL